MLIFTETVIAMITQRGLPEITKHATWVSKYSFGQQTVTLNRERLVQGSKHCCRFIFYRRICSKAGLFCKSLLSAFFNFSSSSKFNFGLPGMTSNSTLVTSRMSVASLLLPSRSCCDKIISRSIQSGLNVFDLRSVDSDCLSTSGPNYYTKGVGASFGGQKISRCTTWDPPPGMLSLYPGIVWSYCLIWDDIGWVKVAWFNRSAVIICTYSTLIINMNYYVGQRPRCFRAAAIICPVK